MIIMFQGNKWCEGVLRRIHRKIGECKALGKIRCICDVRDLEDYEIAFVAWKIRNQCDYEVTTNQENKTLTLDYIY